MLGVEDYGSGSESDREDSPKSVTNANAETLLTALPAPALTDATVIAKSKAKRPKKITIGLPSLPVSVDNEHDEPPAKKARTTGSSASSLLSMLPAQTFPWRINQMHPQSLPCPASRHPSISLP